MPDSPKDPRAPAGGPPPPSAADPDLIIDLEWGAGPVPRTTAGLIKRFLLDMLPRKRRAS